MLKKGKVWPWFCFPSAEWRAPRRRRGLVPIPSPMLAEDEEEGSPSHQRALERAPTRPLGSLMTSQYIGCLQLLAAIVNIVDDCEALLAILITSLCIRVRVPLIASILATGSQSNRQTMENILIKVFFFFFKIHLHVHEASISFSKHQLG